MFHYDFLFKKHFICNGKAELLREGDRKRERDLPLYFTLEMAVMAIVGLV